MEEDARGSALKYRHTVLLRRECSLERVVNRTRRKLHTADSHDIALVQTKGRGQSLRLEPVPHAQERVLEPSTLGIGSGGIGHTTGEGNRQDEGNGKRLCFEGRESRTIDGRQLPSLLVALPLFLVEY